MLRIIALAFAVLVGCVTPTSAAEKSAETPKAAKAKPKAKAVQKKVAEEEVKDGDTCVPFNDTKEPNPKGVSVQPRLRRDYEAWREFSAADNKKTVTFTDPADSEKRVELPVTSTQFCHPKKRVYVTVAGFPGVFTRGSEFEYCTCSNPASVRLVPDLKYDRKSHILCNGELKCPPRPPPRK